MRYSKIILALTMNVVGVSRICKYEVSRLPNQTAAIRGDADGYYIVKIEVFRQLYCLVRVA